MIRWIAVLSTLLLAGCVTTREYVYHDGYYRDAAGYDDGYRDSRYDDRYYSSSGSAGGDYYYREPSYYGSEYPSWYIDYPAYYSVFWPLYRSWYDPYTYPNYYYGVTYYPRNYLSIGFGSGWGWGAHYGYQYYSPYRYSWVDNYYDWRPWHGHRGHGRGRGHHSTPRYGSARNEAERLSYASDWRASQPRARRDRGGYAGSDVRDTAFGRYGTARDGSRGADYGGSAAPRQDPGTRGFGVPTEARYPRDVRRNSYDGGARQDPGVRGFGVPVDPDARGPRRADQGEGGSVAPGRGYGAQREIGRYEPLPPRPQPMQDRHDAGAIGAPSYPRTERAPRGRYDTGDMPRERNSESYGRAPVARDYAPRQPMPSRGYDAGPAPSPREFQTPSPQYNAPEPQYRSSAPEPRDYSPAPEPRSYERADPSPSERFESRQESRSDSGDGGVRRVGSNRDD